VPDINVKELMLEIELIANTLLEWTPAEGWKVRDWGRLLWAFSLIVS